MKILVGLGNPGAQYANTPHSVGFETVDRFASRIGATWESKRQFKCLMARGAFAAVPVLLVKPQTFKQSVSANTAGKRGKTATP